MVSLSSPFTILSHDPPLHCDPTHPALHHLSATLGVCIPTPLALLSTVFGTLSILSWLCAQLPQLIKNYRLRTASGLSIWFLAEWCSGDVANLSGALLTHQAPWQITIGAYYCFVDFSLVLQWLWYERLHHGSPLRTIWRSRLRRTSGDGDDAAPLMTQVIDGFSPLGRDAIDTVQPHTPPTKQASTKAVPQPIGRGLFRTPDYSAALPNDTKDTYADTETDPDSNANQALVTPSSYTPANRRIFRLQPRQALPSPSPRTVLFLTLLLALSSSATPLTPTPTSALHSPLPTLGTLLSWTSTTLYLASRLPQILKNARLRSTAGLSPLLFLAAFCGNTFYSASLLTNPLAWNDATPYGLNGWAGAGGSDAMAWRAAAMPFFLGAAGVLLLDAVVGLQFWAYGDEAGRGEGRVLVVPVVEDGGAGRGRRRWREVSGWMRGWKPSVSDGSPGSVSPSPPPSLDAAEGEREGLLGVSARAKDDGYGAV